MFFNNFRVQQLKQAGLRVGIDFTNKSGRFPNTIKSHALLEYSKDKNGGTKHNEIAEKLFYVIFNLVIVFIACIIICNSKQYLSYSGKEERKC